MPLRQFLGTLRLHSKTSLLVQRFVATRKEFSAPRLQSQWSSASNAVNQQFFSLSPGLKGTGTFFGLGGFPH
jgi:hypothetical protein